MNFTKFLRYTHLIREQRQNDKTTKQQNNETTKQQNNIYYETD